MTSVIWNRNQIVQMICRENEHTLSRWSDAFNCMNCSVLRSTVEFAINFMWNCECNFHASRIHAQMSTTIVICCGCTRFGQRPIERLIALILSLISLLHTTVEHKLFAQCSFDGVPGTHKQRTNNKWNWRSPGSSRPPCLFWLDFWLVFYPCSPAPPSSSSSLSSLRLCAFSLFCQQTLCLFSTKVSRCTAAQAATKYLFLSSCRCCWAASAAVCTEMLLPSRFCAKTNRNRHSAPPDKWHTIHYAKPRSFHSRQVAVVFEWYDDILFALLAQKSNETKTGKCLCITSRIENSTNTH